MAAVDIAGSAGRASNAASPAYDPLAPKPRNGVVDKVAQEVVARWKDGGDELMKQRRDFWQNLSMFYGEQWVWWDSRRNMLQSLPSAYSPLGKGRARIVANHVRPNLQSLLGRMMRNDLEFDVIPSDSGDDVIAGAMLAEDVCSSTYHEQDWRKVRFGENFAKFIGGTSAVCVEWDQAAGVKLAVKPETQKVVGTGEVELTALCINEFCVQPGVNDAKKAKWWIRATSMSPEAVQDCYDLDWLPGADASVMMSPLQQRLLEHMGRSQGSNHLTVVLTMYERPHPKCKKGRVVTVINGCTVADVEWPFPVKDRLNLFVFHQQQVQGSWIGTTLMNDATPLQVHYNFMRSIIAEHAKKVGNARLTAPMGSFIEDDVSDDPGSILWYTPDVGGAKPDYMRPPDLPRWLVGEAGAIKSELDDVMFVHATSRGEASFDRASGQALALLAEKDDSPLGLIAFEESQQWGEIAGFVLKLYEAKVSETRKMKVQPRAGQSGVPRVSSWNGKKLKGQTTVMVPLETTMPTSQAAMQAFARDMWDRGLIKDPVVFARMLRLPNRELVEVLDADAGRAQRENARIMAGEAPQVETFDNDGVHIAEHNRFRKSDSYQYATDEQREICDDHIRWHEQAAAEKMGKQTMLATMNPALAAIPQADEPPGSAVPLDFAEQQAGMGAAAQAGAQMNTGMGGQMAVPPQQMQQVQGAPTDDSVAMAAGMTPT